MSLLGLLLMQTHASVFYPEDVPGTPTNVLVLPASSSTLLVQVLPPSGIKPLGSNGDPVLGYKIDVATYVPDVQTFSIQSADGPITGGSYQLSFTNGAGVTATSTSCIPWNTTPDVFAMALNSLPNLDGVIVTRSTFGAVPQGYVYTITFAGAVLANGAQPNLVTGSAAACTAFQPSNHRVALAGAHNTTGTRGFVPEVWQLTTSESTLTTGVGGTIDVSIGFEGFLTKNLGTTISVDAGSSTARTTAANSLIGVLARNDVLVINGERFRIHATAPFTDTVVPLDSKHIHGANNVAVYTYDTTVGRVAVVLGSASVTTASDYTASLGVGDAVQLGSSQFSVLAITATTVTLDANWPWPSSTHVTLMKRKKTTVRADADAGELAAALQLLPGVGSVQVSRVGPTLQMGFQWFITFTSLGPMACPLAPCLRLTPHLTTEYGTACATCAATITRQNPSPGVLPNYGS
ncbi:hypothetical protein As57867_019245, partial [Aphanomyces stellatus]